MEYTILGKTGLRISRMGFGGIPIQRIDAEGTKALMKQLMDEGVNYIDTAIDYIAQLTLFPSFSKSLKTNFGYIGAILWKHFFQHRFFDIGQFVILTLMKGDKVVKGF